MGPNNIAGTKYLKVKHYDDGHWYLDEQGLLFIVPNTIAEIEGQNGEILNALNQVYRETPFLEVNTDTVSAQLGLVLVPDIYKRFDAIIGYYCC